jgi:CRISPR-associated protein Cas2
MHDKRLNAYHIMWIFVFFDLPVTTKLERKEASVFRKRLLKDGFMMLQYSVYARWCASLQTVEVHRGRVEKIVPPRGKVSVLVVTDKQFGLMQNFFGVIPQPSPAAPPQLELF